MSELVAHTLWINTHEVDDASGSLLVAAEQETLAGLGGPGNVGLSGAGRLLGLGVVGEGLLLEGVGAEEEELLGADQVPEVVVSKCDSTRWLVATTYLGKLAPWALWPS